MTNETILIFQKPDLYFFPHYREIVFAPYEMPELSFRYLIYKALYVLRLPCCSHFWGGWKNAVKDAKKVIIFDYGYQRGMERYIKKVNPSCEVYLFFWNHINKARKNHLLFSDKNAIYSTDKGDCAKYRLRYNHIFYPEDFHEPWRDENKGRLFFVGADKGRAAEIARLKKVLERCGLTCDIRLLKDKTTEENEETAGLFVTKALSYREYLDELSHAGVLLDVNTAGQTALTMRVLESVFLSKKLITKNRDVQNYAFYNDSNIFILPEMMDEPLAAQLKQFLEKPFQEYGEDVRNELGFEHWKAGFQPHGGHTIR